MTVFLTLLLTLGTAAPDFTLPDTVSGKEISLKEIKSDKGTVVMFICNHCPFVKHVQDHLVKMATEYEKKGIRFVAISSNDVKSYPSDGPEAMKKEANQKGYPFPYLYDESQVVAKAYKAACTPEFFLFDGNLKLVYHGQMDDSRPKSRIPVTGNDLRAAMDNLLAGKPISPDQKAAVGCGIKWKK